MMESQNVSNCALSPEKKLGDAERITLVMAVGGGVGVRDWKGVGMGETLWSGVYDGGDGTETGSLSESE